MENPGPGLPEGLVRADELALVGRLLDAVLHRFANALAALKMRLHAATVLTGPLATEASLLADLGAISDEAYAAVAPWAQHAALRRAAPLAIDPAELTAGVEALMAAALEHHGVALQVECPPGLPPVWGRAARLRHLLLHLVLNAVEATPVDRRVILRWAFEPPGGTAEGAGELRVDVIDHGAGMLPEDAGRAFEPFFSTKPEGSGLGLAVCRQIAADHAGRLALASQPGVGTTASLFLPAAAGQAGT
jgi:two-component system sensor histidine kinase HydH